MGISEDIRKTIQSKLVIRYSTGSSPGTRTDCVVCGREFVMGGPLCLYARGDGHVCSACGERFAPEMMRAIEEYRDTDVRKLLANRIIDSEPSTLSKEEWNDIRENLNALLKITGDLAKGISRGIVEAPSGHIGLLHLAKDITKPPRRENESDKDYELRVKGYRMARLFDKIKKETFGRIALLQQYFIKLGLSEYPDQQ